MKQNVSNFDRIVRTIAGLGVFSLFFILSDANRWWALIGVVPLITGFAGWCPVYLLFGIRTCKVE